MMAHMNDVVVVVRDLSNGESLRGYNHTKHGNMARETVYMPFGTEYGFKFKFRDGKRRRLELVIDGTTVTDNLIVRDGSELERFVDSQRRFKFVSAQDEAVGDPTSEDNGTVIIRLYKEEQPPVYRYSGYRDGDLRLGSPLRSRGVSDSGWDSRPTTLGLANDRVFAKSSVSDVQCFASNAITPDFALYDSDSIDSDKGATVEGSVSGQSFGTTTWRGDYGTCDKFVFDFRGRSTVSAPAFVHPADSFLLELSKNPGSTMVVIRPSFAAQLLYLGSDVFVRTTDRETLAAGILGWINGKPVMQNKSLGPDYKIV